MIRTSATTTPKPCQDRKVAATRDACGRRCIRITQFKGARIYFLWIIWEELFKGQFI